MCPESTNFFAVPPDSQIRGPDPETDNKLVPKLSLVFWTGRGGGLTQLSSPSSSDCLPGDAPSRGMMIDAFVGAHRRAAPCGLTKCFGLCFGDGPAAVLGFQRGVVHAAQIDRSTGARRVDRARSDPEPWPPASDASLPLSSGASLCVGLHQQHPTDDLSTNCTSRWPAIQSISPNSNCLVDRSQTGSSFRPVMNVSVFADNPGGFFFGQHQAHLCPPCTPSSRIRLDYGMLASLISWSRILTYSSCTLF